MKPNKNQARTNVIAIVLSALVFIIAIKAFTGDSSNNTSQENTSPVNTTSTTPTATYVFDVPSLVGKNIDQIRALLGQPSDSQIEPTQEQISGTPNWDNTFKKDGVELLVTYNASTRMVIDFFISGTDKPKIMAQGNLFENRATYSVIAVNALRGGGITGIKVVPK